MEDGRMRHPAAWCQTRGPGYGEYGTAAVLVLCLCVLTFQVILWNILVLGPLLLSRPYDPFDGPTNRIWSVREAMSNKDVRNVT